MITPLRVSFDDAPALITGLAVQRAQPVVVVGITGPVGAGKSLLASKLSRCVVATDSYLPDYDEIAYLERDLPTKADYQRLSRDLGFLKQGRDANIPIWSFHTHRREGFRIQMPHPIVVCEGIHALYEPIAAVLDLSVWVDAPAGIRLARWQRMAEAGDRGWGVEETTAFFHDVAEPTFGRCAEAYRARANIIVTNEAAP